jgi:hypothetical protein
MDWYKQKENGSKDRIETHTLSSLEEAPALAYKG